MRQANTKKQTTDNVERRLLAGELDASTTTLADVLPDTAKAAFAGYGIAATMQGTARRIAAFMDVLNGYLQFRRENPKLYDAIYEANAQVEEMRFCKNIAVEDEMPPIFSGLLADFYGIKPRNGDAGELDAELKQDLAPDESKTDAIQYCARLVCHVWNTNEHGGKRKSTDYVFVKAQKGDNLFGVCNRARGLADKWAIPTGTVQTQAARLHAVQSGTKHKKRDGMERPETMRQAAKKSREKEQAEERAERKRKANHGTRQSGKKR